MACGRLWAKFCRLLAFGGILALAASMLSACFSAVYGGGEGLGSLTVVQAVGIAKPLQTAPAVLQRTPSPIEVLSADQQITQGAAEARPQGNDSKGVQYDIAQTQQRRQSVIRSVCAERRELRRPTPWRYKYDSRHNMLYCPIPKSGWSSWKRVFFYINGAIKNMDVEIGITPDKNASILELTGYAVLRRNASGLFRPYSFMFVRDPWQRLLSAYINKALDWNYTRILHTPCEWETMTPYRKPITFVQFLTCIVDRAATGKRLDIHWTPMWQLCDMCQVRYSAIGHMETIADDARHILKSAGLQLSFPTIFASQAHKAADVARDWYSSVPVAVLQKLQKLYELDFKLNEYSSVPPGWEGRL